MSARAITRTARTGVGGLGMTSGFSAALRDLRGGLVRHRLWRFLAIQDIRLRYARSFIGPFWLSLTMACYVIALGFVFGGLFGAPLRQVVPWITSGVIVWTFLTAVFNEGAMALMAARGHLLQTELPVTTFVWLVLLRNGIVSAHHMVVFVLVQIAFLSPPTLALLWFPLGVLILLAFSFGIGLFLALVTPRFRDLAPFITSMMVVGFFITPVMWRPHDLVQNHFVATFNPFTHLIAVVRDPLLGAAPSVLSLAAATAAAVIALLAGILALVATRHRVTYWI